MNKFRPQEVSKPYAIKMRRLTGRFESYNWQSRDEWYPVGYKSNKIAIGRQFGCLHYLARHAPAPVRKRWTNAYRTFMNKHFGDASKASIHYLNKWSCHSWL
jgi:hypothetical protein